jgi:hypothetical protein
MHYSKPLLCCALGAAALLFEQAALATTYQTSGQRCHPYIGSGGLNTTSNLYRDQRGTGNRNTSSITVLTCGLRSPNVKVDVFDFFVFYSDKNPSPASPPQDVLCSMQAWGSTVQFYSAPRFGCGTLGGCAAPSAGYKGDGVITLSNPLNSGSPLTGVSMSITCVLPNAVTSSPIDYSFINAYGIDAVAAP